MKLTKKLDIEISKAQVFAGLACATAIVATLGIVIVRTGRRIK